MADAQFPTPQQLKRVDEQLGIVHLMTGKTAQGEEFYAYINVRPSMYEEYCRKIAAHERMNLNDYGKILKKGLGAAPSEDVKRFMEEEYGLEPDFAAKWAAMIEDEIAKLRKNK